MDDLYVGPRKKYVDYANSYTSSKDMDITNIVKNVIFNEPATIVIWRDGTKTVVICSQNDTYSKETGLALCFMKHYMNNDNSFHKILKKFCMEDTK